MPIWIMIHFDWLFTIFRHYYNLIWNFFLSCHKNIMLYILKIGDSLKIATDEESEGFHSHAF